MRNKINTVSAMNLKGSSFEHELSDITVFHGRNAAGKTTRLEALALATTRELPGPKGQCICHASDIFESLASGQILIARAVATDGTDASAEWQRNRKGDVKGVFTGQLLLPPLLFHIGEFLDLTPKERTRFLFEKLPPPPLDKVGPSAVVTKLKNFKAEPHTEAHEKSVEYFCDNVRETWHLGNKVVQEWLEELFQWADAETKALKQSAKTMRSTVLGTTALRTDAPALGETEAAAAAAQATYKQRVDAEAQAQAAYDLAVKDYKQSRQLADKVVDEQEAQVQLAALVANPVPVMMPAGLKPLPGQMAGPRPDVTGLLASKQALQGSVSASNSTIESNRININSIKEQITAAKARTTTCPHCEHTWYDAGLVAVLVRDLEAAELNLVHAKVVLEHNHSAAAMAINSWANACKSAESWDADKAALDFQNQTALDEWNSRVEAGNANTKDSYEHQRQVDLLKSKLAANGPAREAWVALPGLEKAGHARRDALTAAQSSVAAASVEVDAAQARHREALADAAKAKTAQEAADKATLEEAKAQVGQALRDLLDELLRECIKQSVGPLVDICNDLCRDILPYPLAFIDAEVVLYDQSRSSQHSHRTASGTEKTLVYAALAVALAADAPVRLVALDEFDIDNANLRMLVLRLGELIAADKLDQAIICHTSPVTGVGVAEFGGDLPAGITFSQIEVKR